MPRKPRSNPLNDLQLVILSTATGRDDRSVLPWPKSLRSEPGLRDAAVNAMIKRGYLHEEPGAIKSKTWRVDQDGQRFGLWITDAGLAALEPGVAVPAKPVEAKRANTKSETILSLLRSVHGTTIADLMSATGWQAHSIRGFLSGTVTKKLGLTVRSEKLEGSERRYHVGA
jgi:hypothetical protein